jgi:nitroreductase
MNLSEVIHRRRTHHSYKKTTLSDDLIEEALLAALTAPNHRHTFPWRFIHVSDAVKMRLAERATQLKEEKLGKLLEESAKKKHFEKYLHPELVVFLSKRSEDTVKNQEDYAAVSCAIQNFSLVMTDAGYGSKWSSGSITRDQKAFELLEIEPDREYIVGFVWVGEPLDQPKPRRRPPLEDVLTRL